MRIALLTILALLLVGSIALILKNNPSAPITPVVTVPEPQVPVVQPATKDDMIVLDYPLAGSTITSPLTITGKARGNWYFEASFPVVLVDWDGRIIAEGHAEAQGDWMTTEYVPFKGTITFTKPDTSVSSRGWIILKKDNPSGESKFDNALEVEIKYN
jgi:hypothetical protein